MKHWYCPYCFWRRDTDDKVIIKICPRCMEEMEIVTEKLYTNGLGTIWDRNGKIIKEAKDDSRR